jgi:lipid-binding SYLF domain-containing protein
LFAGASLGSADLSTDDDANKTVYGRDISASQIVREGQVKTTQAGQRIVDVLKKESPKWSGS